jgi:hypothetical protein
MKEAGSMKVGSFALLLPAMLLAGAAITGAQQPAPPPPPTAPPPPGPAALSVPNPLAGLKPGPRDLYQSPDGSDRFQHLSRHPVPPFVFAPGGYFPGPYNYSPFYYPGPYPYGAATAEMAYPQRYQDAIPHGGLVLATIPDTAQVFVDGYYVGLAEEFGLRGRPMDITAGTHHIELRAQGYEQLAFNVMIGANDIVRYRGDMQLLRSAQPAATGGASTPAARKNFFVIPNCYAGDKPPARALPKGCDVKKLQTRK